MGSTNLFYEGGIVDFFYFLENQRRSHLKYISHASSSSVDGEIFHMPVFQSAALSCVPRSFPLTITFFDSCPDDRTHLGPFLVFLTAFYPAGSSVGVRCGVAMIQPVGTAFHSIVPPFFFSIVVFRNAVSLFLLALLHCSDNSSIISLLLACSSTNQLLMEGLLLKQGMSRSTERHNFQKLSMGNTELKESRT